MRTSGQIQIRARALEPIHHGAGISGNTQLLRMQAIVLDDGTPARVPFISGNSIKHKLRAAAAQYALDVMAVEDGSLSKAEVDLLFSGGHLSKAGGAVNLEKARQLEELFPALSMCGYSAGNCMTESKLRVSHLHLVCVENAWRVPDDLAESPMLKLRAGGHVSENFGTRHDQGGSNIGQRLLTEGAQTDRAKKKSKKLSGEAEGKGDSAQMIYDFQTIMPGSRFWGTVWFADMTDLECAALASAFHYAAAGKRDGALVAHVGAKSSIGYGAIAVELKGQVRADAAAYQPSEALVGKENAGRAEQYNAHLRDRRGEILDAIKEAVK